MQRDTCRTCGQAANRPYRNRVQGIVEEGCVDSFHDRAMRTDTWHNRPAAKTLRKEIKAKHQAMRQEAMRFPELSDA